MVRFDEGNILLKEWTYHKDIDELIFQIKNDDVIGRIWAIEQLDNIFDSILSDEVTRVLEYAATEDPAWAVREASLECLERINGTVNMHVLIKAVNDEHHRVRNKAQKIKNEK